MGKVLGPRCRKKRKSYSSTVLTDLLGGGETLSFAVKHRSEKKGQREAKHRFGIFFGPVLRMFSQAYK